MHRQCFRLALMFAASGNEVCWIRNVHDECPKAGAEQVFAVGEK
jgi:hypothetical protein